ncbi:hypothetical protein OG429_40280 (plasmid) [Streptomyces sp. NBC_00190]|uniref:hypothetical protein n=1 Tax=unclassified Streptomyces TaxID=2593676 RepID=UPI002E29D84D|nr:hypothetical protein [Streptomyces sp. NBC_00190]WSZ45796.1 hypothetical protein OG239_44335 [Streptomyces sp. NBC_00868]
MPSRPAPRRSFPVDLAVFLAILATGVILVLVGHVSPEALAGYASALAGLYAAYHHRPTRTQRESPETSPTPAGEGQKD